MVDGIFIDEIELVDNRKLWHARVIDFRASGLSGAVFYAKHQLKNTNYGIGWVNIPQRMIRTTPLPIGYPCKSANLLRTPDLW